MVDWKKAWQEKTTPWDLGKPHPATQLGLEIAASYQKKLEGQGGPFIEKKVLIPLCGTAHDALPFLREGFDAHAFDLSERAVEKANHVYGPLGLKAFTADIFQLDSMSQQFGYVLDRAALCAMDKLIRMRYVEALTKRIVPGAYYIFIAFSQVADAVSGPPFAISVEEVAGLFGKSFHLVHAEAVTPPKEIGAIEKETLYIWRKNEK